MKTTKYLGFLLLTVVLLSPACEYLFHHHKPTPDCEIGEPFQLWYGQTVTCEDWEVTFTGEIVDSRCPTTVTCVWAGRVDVELQVGEELISLGLPDDPELGQSKVTLGTRVIELLQVLPYPDTADPIDNESYRVRLFVTDL